MVDEPRALLRALFDAAIARAVPKLCLPPHLPPRPAGRLVVVGAGKAAAALAAAVEDHYGDPLDFLSGAVVTRYGHLHPTRRIAVIEAGHPVPDAAGMAGARRLLALVGGLSADDRVLCLISGGGSALLTCPAPPITLEAMQALTRALLRSGAAIGEMNAVRKHLSAIAGGRLAAAAHPAPLLTLAISDVPGDDPSTIASGPTVPDPTTRDDARAVLARYGIAPDPAIAQRLADPDCETPKPGDPRLAAARFAIVASAKDSLAAAAALAQARGFTPLVLGDAIEGESREVAQAHARLALDIKGGRGPVTPPAAILSGGETTVTVRGQGRGGRDAEFLLALAIALDGAAGIHALAGDTDGIDGSEDNAGAVCAPDTLARARGARIDAARHLADNDAYGFFAALGDLVVTGPTLTNVNDFRAILIAP
jgi:hydroxypyruvate reductase